MRDKKALITAVGGDIGQSIIKCLKEIDPEIDLLGCDIDPCAAGRGYVRKFLIAPQALDAQRYFKFITAVIEEHNPSYIYPNSEDEILFFDAHRDHFSKKGVDVFINNSFILSTFSDKYKTVQFLKENGLPYPATFLITEYDNQLGYPLIIKPRKGCASKGMIKVNNGEEFDFYKKRTHGAIVQEYIGNDEEEYTTGVFSNGKNIHSITFKRKLGFSGVSKTARLVTDHRIDNLAKQIAISSSLVGSINVQSRKTSKGFIVFEINPRFSSTVYFRHHFGFQDVRWWMELSEDRSREIDFQLKHKIGIAVRTLTEVFFDTE